MMLTRTLALSSPLLFPLVFPLAALAAPPTQPASTQVPVVLDVTGVNRSHFTADLLVVNRSATASRVELRFTSTAGTSVTAFSGVLSEETLEPGARFYRPDVVAYLRERGAALPEEGSPVVGTLLVRLPDVQDDAPPYAATRISTPNPSLSVGGSFGTFAVGVPVGSASSQSTSVYGLRETPGYRTNLAVVHAGGGSNRPIELRIQLVDGKTGLLAGDPIVQALLPGQWFQFASILNLRQLEQGWARVSQSAGDDRFIAYAVVNDGGSAGVGTSDGSFIESGTKDGFLPIALSSGPFRTELVLVNDSLVDSVVSLTYTSADALGATSIPGLSARVTLSPRVQVIEPDAIDYLRRLGIGIPETLPQGGTIRVVGAAALARVYSPNPDAAVGGTFGLSFPAVRAEKRAKTEAWLYGVRQDITARTNIAIANAIFQGDTTSTLEVAAFQPGGVVPRKTVTRTLKPGQWFQFNAILQDSGLTSASVRVKCTTSTGSCDFLAYGVVNDGNQPGQGTSDGSYLPMADVK